MPFVDRAILVTKCLSTKKVLFEHVLQHDTTACDHGGYISSYMAVNDRGCLTWVMGIIWSKPPRHSIMTLRASIASPNGSAKRWASKTSSVSWQTSNTCFVETLSAFVDDTATSGHDWQNNEVFGSISGDLSVSDYEVMNRRTSKFIRYSKSVAVTGQECLP